MDGRRHLALYLSEHLVGAAAGLEMFRRAARAHRDSAAGPVLERLTEEVAEDRATLVRLVRALGLPAVPGTGAVGRLVDAVGRLKPGGHLLTRSPLGSLVQLETLRMGVEGKQALWEALREVADRWDALDPDALDALLARAKAQAQQLEALRREAARRALSP